MDEVKTEREERLPLTVSRDVLKRIRTANSPQEAIAGITFYPCDVAVEIIDNLDPLTAAFMIATFQHRAEGGFFGSTLCSVQYAKSLIQSAQELQIRGTLGFCYAHDQVLREIGFLART